MTLVLTIQPRDPIVARDGRPFGSVGSNRMKSLDWPLPTTVAGAVRTLLGQSHGGNFDAAMIARLKDVSCQGPLPVSEGQLFVPAAEDAIFTRDSKCVTLRPEEVDRQSVGLDLPCGLWPALPRELPESKLREVPAWWSVTKMIEWLLEPHDADPEFFNTHDHFRQSPVHDERSHVKIDPNTFAAQDQMLYSSTGLTLDRLLQAADANVSYPAHLVIRIDTTDQEFQATVQTLATFQPLGGERRVVHVCHDPAEQVRFDCPIQIRNVLAKVQVGDGVRMALATPAIFEHGWRPAWLAPNEAGHLVGTPPEAPDTLRLELVSVSNQRWDAVSGWSYEEPRGPKPVKRMVPAGGVYFFRVKQGDASVLTDRWLQPVSDDAQDRRDGFGLAMWGVWEKH